MNDNACMISGDHMTFSYTWNGLYNDLNGIEMICELDLLYTTEQEAGGRGIAFDEKDTLNI